MKTVPAEIRQKVKLLEIQTRRLVDNIFSGEYHTHFKGQGMTFSEFREYVPGDDVRAISWALTARTGKPYIKKFDEERELTIMLAVDVSGSGEFGSGSQPKGEALIHLSALLALSAVKNKDQVGLLLFSDQVEHFVPPAKGVGHVHRILRDLYYFKPKSRRTQIGPMCSYLRGILKKKSTVFVLSDFIDQNFEASLRILARKHEVVAVLIEDPLEKKFPEVGLVEFEDLETGDIVTVDTSSSTFQKSYQDEIRKRTLNRDELLRKSQVACIKIVNGKSIVDPVVAFFKSRAKR